MCGKAYTPCSLGTPSVRYCNICLQCGFCRRISTRVNTALGHLGNSKTKRGHTRLCRFMQVYIGFSFFLNIKHSNVGCGDSRNLEVSLYNLGSPPPLQQNHRLLMLRGWRSPPKIVYVVLHPPEQKLLCAEESAWPRGTFS